MITNRNLPWREHWIDIVQLQPLLFNFNLNKTSWLPVFWTGQRALSMTCISQIYHLMTFKLNKSIANHNTALVPILLMNMSTQHWQFRLYCCHCELTCPGPRFKTQFCNLHHFSISFFSGLWMRRMCVHLLIHILPKQILKLKYIKVHFNFHK